MIQRNSLSSEEQSHHSVSGIDADSSLTANFTILLNSIWFTRKQVEVISGTMQIFVTILGKDICRVTQVIVHVHSFIHMIDDFFDMVAIGDSVEWYDFSGLDVCTC